MYTANNQLERLWPLSSIVIVFVPGIALSEMSMKSSSVVCHKAFRKMETGRPMDATKEVRYSQRRAGQRMTCPNHLSKWSGR